MKRALGLSLLATLSCSFDPAVPPDASIGCTGDAECPPTWVCQPTLARCVPATALDLEAPAVVASSVVLQLRPLVGNRLARPQALGALGEAQISFTVSEPLARAPALTNSCGLECSRSRDDLTSFAFSCRTTAQATEGECALQVELVDESLNDAVVPLPGLRVDVTAPPPPPTGEANAVVYHRRPQGSAMGGDAAEWHVAIAAPLDDAVALLARSGAFERALAELDGGTPGAISLLAHDSPALEVASIDAAGNQSAWAKVRDGRWIATAGAAGPSPHRLELVGALGPLARNDVVTRGAGAGLTPVDGEGATVAGSASWTRADLGAPIAAIQGAIAVDLGRSRVVRVGGDTPSILGLLFGGVEPVCEWRGEGWQCSVGDDPESDGNPEPRAKPVLVYDEARRQIVLHGGRNILNEAMGDTWAWSGRSWKRLSTGPAVTSAAGFWDTPRRRLVLFGGSGDGGLTDEGWTFDGTTWSRLPPAGLTPRRGAALAYDRHAGVAWLFGGETAGGLVAETWRYDGAAWAEVDAGPGPPARTNAAFAWDFDRGEGLLWGGQGPDGGWRQDAWWWDGTRWSQRGDGGLPSYRQGGDTLAYEPWGRRFIGSTMRAQGQFLTDISSESWLMKDGGVTGVPIPSSPPPSAVRPAMTCRGPLGCVALNEAGRLVRFGRAGFEPAFASDAGLPALVGASHRLAWDSRRGRFVATVVTVDGGTGTWELLEDAGTWWWEDRGVPSAQGMSFLADMGSEVVSTSAGRLASPPDSRVTAWNGTSWSSWGAESLPVPTPGALHASLTGTERSDGGFWVLVSTSNPYQQVLYEVVDGGTWLPGPAGEPAPIATGMLAEDPLRRRLVAAHGLVRSITPNASTFERVGAGQWAQLADSDPEGDGSPAARVGGAMGWEPRTESLLAIGGSPVVELLFTEKPMTDAWRLQVSPHRPAAVFRASLDELQLEPGVELVSLEVRATAGGVGEADGGLLEGARLATWAVGRWEDPGVEHGGGVDQPAPLSLRVDDARRLRSLLLGQPDVNAALTTRGANGSSHAKLFVDAVEVEVAYRLPP